MQARVATLLAALLPPGAAAAQVPGSSFYVGLGAALNAADFGSQDAFAVGTSDVYRGGVLFSSGSAAGPGTVALGSDTAVAPVLRIGAFRRFGDGGWLLGAELNYAHLGASAEAANVLLPQAGSFTPTGTTTPVPFLGTAVVRSYQSEITHQFGLVPFIGHVVGPGFVYAGAGPTLSRVRTRLNGLVGFASIDGRPTDVSGAPQDFAASSWVVGGTAVIGMGWLLAEGWFVDLRYSYAATRRETENYASAFLNPRGAQGTVISGTLVGNTSGTVATQGVALTINRAF
jgi:opacity protein-like surface antigen